MKKYKVLRLPSEYDCWEYKRFFDMSLDWYEAQLNALVEDGMVGEV